MSDELIDSGLDASDEYEEISSDEVDRVVEALEELADGVHSENIRALLEDASQSVYDLVYDEEDEVEVEVEADDDTDELLESDELLEDEEEDEVTPEAA